MIFYCIRKKETENLKKSFIATGHRPSAKNNGWGRGLKFTPPKNASIGFINCLQKVEEASQTEAGREGEKETVCVCWGGGGG